MKVAFKTKKKKDLGTDHIHAYDFVMWSWSQQRRSAPTFAFYRKCRGEGLQDVPLHAFSRQAIILYSDSAPTTSPTTASPTSAPTLSPTTEAPTAVPTSSPTTAFPTSAPTLSPTTEAPTPAAFVDPCTVGNTTLGFSAYCSQGRTACIKSATTCAETAAGINSETLSATSASIRTIVGSPPPSLIYMWVVQPP